MKSISKFLFLVAMATALFVGCSGGDKGGATTAPAAETAAPAADQKPADAGITGSYKMEGSAGELADLMVDQAGESVRFKLSASAGNAAESEFSGNLVKKGDGSYEYQDDGCYIAFKFSATGCDVSYASTPEGCGLGDGGADVQGAYKLVSHDKPAI